jgi:hypothetical protein
MKYQSRVYLTLATFLSTLAFQSGEQTTEQPMRQPKPDAPGSGLRMITPAPTRCAQVPLEYRPAEPIKLATPTAVLEQSPPTSQLLQHSRHSGSGRLRKAKMSRRSAKQRCDSLSSNRATMIRVPGFSFWLDGALPPDRFEHLAATNRVATPLYGLCTSVLEAQVEFCASKSFRTRNSSFPKCLACYPYRGPK